MSLHGNARVVLAFTVSQMKFGVSFSSMNHSALSFPPRESGSKSTSALTLKLFFQTVSFSLAPWFIFVQIELGQTTIFNDNNEVTVGLVIK